jgi:hypothetical protein
LRSCLRRAARERRGVDKIKLPGLPLSDVALEPKVQEAGILGI